MRSQATAARREAERHRSAAENARRMADELMADLADPLKVSEAPSSSEWERDREVRPTTAGGDRWVRPNAAGGQFPAIDTQLPQSSRESSHAPRTSGMDNVALTGMSNALTTQYQTN